MINQAFEQNFRNDPPAHLSLLGIALECGFNSEASFYRIFRQMTGVSPNHYAQNRLPYTTTRQEQIIEMEVHARRPVFLHFANLKDFGHSVVIDGYKTDSGLFSYI